MARSDTAGLRIVHDPGRTAAGASLASLAVCLAFAAYSGQALYRGSPGPSGDPGVDTLLFAGFVLGAVFFVGWTLHSLRGRRKTLRIYQVESGEVVCRGGAGELWREALAAYREVGLASEQRSTVTKYGRQYYTVAVATLRHPRAERCVELFAQQDAAKVEAVARRWSAALGLPVVREGGAAAIA
jgi:hypothetical protein